MASPPPADRPGDELEAALRRLAGRFKERLAVAAEEVRLHDPSAGELTPAHVDQAYRRLLAGPAGPRDDARRLVNAAFRDNRTLEWVGYGTAGVLLAVGLVLVLAAGFAAGDPTARVTGGTAAWVVLGVPLRFVANARRHNFGLRLLGLVLDRVDDPKVLAELTVRLADEITPYGRRPPRSRP